MIVKAANLGTCKVVHDVSIPSKLTDYDYDPCRPERRFLSTYLHKIIFSDPVTDAELSCVSFESITCADLISALYKITFQQQENISITIENVYVGLGSCRGIIILTKCMGVVKFTVCDFITPSVTFDIIDTRLIIDVLDVDIMEGMFVVYSDEHRGG